MDLRVDDRLSPSRAARRSVTVGTTLLPCRSPSASSQSSDPQKQAGRWGGTVWRDRMNRVPRTASLRLSSSSTSSPRKPPVNKVAVGLRLQAIPLHPGLVVSAQTRFRRSSDGSGIQASRGTRPGKPGRRRRDRRSSARAGPPSARARSTGPRTPARMSTSAFAASLQTTGCFTATLWWAMPGRRRSGGRALLPARACGRQPSPCGSRIRREQPRGAQSISG